MTTYENFRNSFRPAIELSMAVSLISILSNNLTKDSIGFKNETNERIKSFLFSAASLTLLMPLFYGDWNHLFDNDDNVTNMSLFIFSFGHVARKGGVMFVKAIFE